MDNRISGRLAWLMTGALAVAACAVASAAFAHGGNLVGKPHFVPNGLASTGPVAVADLNGDGRKDIVAGSSGDQSISVLYGKKHGFKPFHRYPSDTTQSWLVIGDVNRDGRPDIVFTSIEGQPRVMLARKGGGFGPATLIPTGNAASFGALADFNHDHKLDLVASNESTDDLSYYAGHGDGTFGAAKTITMPVGGTPYTLVPTDLNRDGDMDLAVLAADAGGGSVISPLHGTGHGGFTAGESTIVTNHHLYGMVAGHFDSDKRLDFAATDCGGVFLVHGTKNGLVSSPRFANDPESCSLSPAAVDMNGDGRTDLVSTQDAGTPTGNIVVQLGTANGRLGGPHLYKAIQGGGTFRDVVTADFNKDGRPDLAVPAGNTVPKQGVGVLYGKKK